MVTMPISTVESNGMVVDFAGYPELMIDMLRTFLAIQLKLECLDHDMSPPILQLYTP